MKHLFLTAALMISNLSVVHASECKMNVLIHGPAKFAVGPAYIHGFLSSKTRKEVLRVVKEEAEAAGVELTNEGVGGFQLFVDKKNLHSIAVAGNGGRAIYQVSVGTGGSDDYLDSVRNAVNAFFKDCAENK